jgi:hypothetical protein
MDPEVVDAALKAALDYAPEENEGPGAMEAALLAADEKRGIRVETMEPDPRSTTQFAPQWRYVSGWHSSDGQAQADPEGQEHAYRVAWDARRDGVMRTKPMSLEKAEQFASELDCAPWVERALLGAWEKIG